MDEQELYEAPTIEQLLANAVVIGRRLDEDAGADKRAAVKAELRRKGYFRKPNPSQTPIPVVVYPDPDTRRVPTDYDVAYEILFGKRKE